MTAPLEISWSRIADWLRSNRPELTPMLGTAASIEAILETEATIGGRLPETMRESYLLQDGFPYGEQELPILPGHASEGSGYCLLPIEGVAEEWTIWKDLIDDGTFKGETSQPDAGITDRWWSDAWIPIGGNGAGDLLCIDLQPAEGGTVGQVIEAIHDDDDRKLLAASWPAYLETLADGLTSGRVVYDDEIGLIWDDAT